VDQQDTFFSHLIELRDRLVRSLIGIGIFFICLFPFAPKLYSVLAMPMLAKLPKGGQMIATDVTTPFFVPMKVAAMTAFLIALPYVLYQVWAFIAPGLYQHEKRLAMPLVISSTFLFFVGMAFAYFLVFPMVFGFITGYAPEGVAVMTDINKYLSFVLGMFLAFGVAFETPIAVILLLKMGVVSVQKLKEFRPYMIVGAFVVAAVVTPPDVVSQFMLAVPLCILYELGIWLSGFIGQPKPAQSTEIVESSGNK
jgi:sec-independent protein translocase protein TatC